MNHDFAAIANYELLRKWVDAAELKGTDITVGNVFTSDTFYHLSDEIYDVASRLQIVAVEMEAAGYWKLLPIFPFHTNLSVQKHGREGFKFFVNSVHLEVTYTVT